MKEQLTAALLAAQEQNLLTLHQDAEDIADILAQVLENVATPPPQASAEAPPDADQNPEFELARAFWRKFYRAKNHFLAAIERDDGPAAVQWGEVLRALEIYKNMRGSAWYLFAEE